MKNNIIVADWKDEKIAKAHNELNKNYFIYNEYSKFECFFKLKEALCWIINENNYNKLNLLDVGCGAAWQAVYLKKENLIPPINYTGIDLSKHMCNFAKNNFPEGDFYQFDICEKEFSSLLLYDIVIESAVLELVHNWKKALINMLKSSNMWFIPHRLFFKENNTYVEQVSTYNNIPDLRTHIGMNDFNNILKEQNFELIKTDIWETGYYNMGTFICKKKI